MSEKKYLDASGVKTLWDNVVQKIPTKTSELTNDSGFLNVTLAAVATSGSYSDLSGKPSKVSDFENDSGFLTSHQDISGLETKANAITGLSVSGTTITYTKGSGTSATISTQDTWIAFEGASSENDGISGYVPAPGKGNQNMFFKADGTWGIPINTTYSDVSVSESGLMTASDKSKLDGIAENANNYVLPAANSELGGVKTTSSVTSTSGLTAVPIIDGVPYYKNTTYSAMSATEATAGTATSARTISAKVLNDKIDEKVSVLVASAPETLDTLNELAGALGNDPNFAATVATQIGSKANSADLATVATSGSYSDLSDKPSKVSDFENDSGFLTEHQDISGKANDSEVVHLTGNETIAGVKTFKASPTLDGSSLDYAYYVIEQGAYRNSNRGNYTGTSLASGIKATGKESGLGLETIGSLDFTLVGNTTGMTSDMAETGDVITSIGSYNYDRDNSKVINTLLYLKTPNDISKNIDFYPNKTDTVNLGTSARKWKNVYAANVYASNVYGTIEKATGNANGYSLSNDIIKGLSVSGNQLTYTKIDGSSGNLTIEVGNTVTKTSELENDSKFITETDAETWQTNRLKPQSVTVSINNSEWSEKTVTKNVGVDSKYYCQLGVPISSDTSNLANISNANIIITEHSGNNMTFKCLGNVPTSAITLELTVFYYDVIDKDADYFNITEAELNAIFG